MSYIKILVPINTAKTEITVELTFIGPKKIVDIDGDQVRVENILPLNNNLFTNVDIRSGAYLRGESNLPTSITIRNDKKGYVGSIKAPIGTKRIRIVVLAATNPKFRGVVNQAKTIKFKDGNQLVKINQASITTKSV